MRKSLFALLLIIVTVCLLGGCEKRRDDFYQKAVEYYNKGMITEAGLEIKNALSIDSECAPCLLIIRKDCLGEG